MRGKKGRACGLRRPVHAPTPSPPSLTQPADPLLPPSPPKKPRRRRRQQRHARCSTGICLTFARALPLMTAGHQSCGRARLAPAAACSRRAAGGLDKVPLRLSRGEWTWRRSTTRAASRAPPRRCATSSRRCATCRTAAEGAYARSLGRGKGAHRPPRAAQMCGERKRSQWAACTVQSGGWSCGVLRVARRGAPQRATTPPRQMHRCAAEAPPAIARGTLQRPLPRGCDAGGEGWVLALGGARIAPRGARGAQRGVPRQADACATRAAQRLLQPHVRGSRRPHTGNLTQKRGHALPPIARACEDRDACTIRRRRGDPSSLRGPRPKNVAVCAARCSARPFERPLSSDAGSTSAFVGQGEAARPRVQARSRVLAALNAARSP